MQVGVAHAAVLDSNTHFAWARLRSTELPLFELGLGVVSCQGDRPDPSLIVAMVL
jgi:hypothetical protein